MINPWLRIPASDYEGHMSNPKVAQLRFLAQTFKESLDKHDSSTTMGVAHGKGRGITPANSNYVSTKPGEGHRALQV